MGDDESWTVVVRRRSSKIRASSSAISARHSGSSSESSKRRRRVPSAPALLEEECDEALLLLRMKRSLARVQGSAFFERFLDQVQSPPVLNHLLRAASDSGFEKIVVDDDDVEQQRNGVFLTATMRPCVSAQNHLVSPAKDNMSESASSSPRATIVQLYESAPNNWECLVCCNRYNSEGKCVCMNAVATDSTYFATSKKGLASIDGMEGYEDSIMKQRPTCQVTEKRWCLRVVLYGLGSIADSEISRCQFALILLLKQRFTWVGEIEVYDPVLFQSERKVIEDMGCLPIAIDEKGRRRVSGPTLFYMPHCEEWLYDNVLQANWVPHTLGQLVILGNSFQDYQERWSSSIGRKSKPPYLLQYQQLAREIPLVETPPLDLPGFNNMSWHFYEPCDKGNSTLSEAFQEHSNRRSFQR